MKKFNLPSTNLTAEVSAFIALVKVISFDCYLEREFSGGEKRIHYAKAVEIIKNTKEKKIETELQCIETTEHYAVHI